MARLLVIDQLAATREHLASVLGAAGHQVAVAGTAAEALRHVGPPAPELVIGDLLMPTPDSLPLLEQLREVPVIFRGAPERIGSELLRSQNPFTVLSEHSDADAIVAAVARALHHRATIRGASSQVAPQAPAPLRGPLRESMELALEMATQRDPEQLLQALFDGAKRILGARHAGLFIRQHPHDASRPWLRPDDDAMNPLVAGAPLPAILQRSREHNRLLYCDASEAAALLPGLPPSTRVVVLPVATADAHYGWLYFARDDSDSAFSPQNEQLLDTMMRGSSIFYEHLLLYEQARRHGDELRAQIAQREASEAAYRRLNRVHAMRSRINSKILYIRTRQQLFDELCRTAVEQGGFRMGWIGVPAPDGLLPVAMCGVDPDYIEERRRQLARDRHESPARRVLRLGCAEAVNDIAQQIAEPQQRDAALQRGLRSMAALPLWESGGTAAVLCLYAAETDFFNDDEMSLLGELASDMTQAMEFIAREERVDFLSHHDPLTGLANRTQFLDRLEQQVLAARANGSMVAAVIVDIEKFKSVNDALGPRDGDQLLKAVAERLVRFVGSSGHVARVGGDRFALLIPDLARAEDLTPLLQGESWTRLSRAFGIGPRKMRLTGKVGVALFPSDADSAVALFRNAEAALKKAKESGERLLFYTGAMGAALQQKLELESHLRHALEEQQFKLYYQPKIDLRSGRICGAEALLRWTSAELGVVSPSRFIPLMEESGLIVDIGRWALSQAMNDRWQWQQQGLKVPPIAVNVSASQLRQAEFIDDVKQALARHDNQAGLELEITESMVMSNTEPNIDKLHRLRELGVTVGLDDFGTGYSSLAYLSKLPLNTLKIDRSFIVSMTGSPGNLSIVSTIIALAHSMNLKVVAEGVDAVEQLRLLRLLNCDEMQGFLFSQAVPADDFAAMLQEDRRLLL